MSKHYKKGYRGQGNPNQGQDMEKEPEFIIQDGVKLPKLEINGNSYAHFMKKGIQPLIAKFGTAATTLSTGRVPIEGMDIPSELNMTLTDYAITGDNGDVGEIIRNKSAQDNGITARGANMKMNTTTIGMSNASTSGTTNASAATGISSTVQPPGNTAGEREAENSRRMQTDDLDGEEEGDTGGASAGGATGATRAGGATTRVTTTEEVEAAEKKKKMQEMEEKMEIQWLFNIRKDRMVKWQTYKENVQRMLGVIGTAYSSELKGCLGREAEYASATKRHDLLAAWSVVRKCCMCEGTANLLIAQEKTKKNMENIHLTQKGSVQAYNDEWVVAMNTYESVNGQIDSRILGMMYLRQILDPRYTEFKGTLVKSKLTVYQCMEEISEHETSVVRFFEVSSPAGGGKRTRSEGEEEDDTPGRKYAMNAQVDADGNTEAKVAYDGSTWRVCKFQTSGGRVCREGNKCPFRHGDEEPGARKNIIHKLQNKTTATTGAVFTMNSVRNQPEPKYCQVMMDNGRCDGGCGKGDDIHYATAAHMRTNNNRGCNNSSGSSISSNSGSGSASSSSDSGYFNNNSNSAAYANIGQSAYMGRP